MPFQLWRITPGKLKQLKPSFIQRRRIAELARHLSVVNQFQFAEKRSNGLQTMNGELVANEQFESLRLLISIAASRCKLCL